MKKLILAAGLAVIAGLGINFGLLKTKEAASSQPQLEIKQKLKVKEQQKLAREFKVKELYQTKKGKRKSPFLIISEGEVKFSYSRAETEKSSPPSVNSDHSLASKEQTKEREKEETKTKKVIKPAKLELYLQGIVKKAGQTLIITANQQESYILEVGDLIKGYRVKKIDGDRVILAKDNQLYQLRSRLKVYNSR